MAHIQDQKFQALGFQKSSSSKRVVAYHKDLDTAGADNPILVLLHGYPNSAYLWRHIVPLLPNKPLFVPDLPGYGNSAAPSHHDKVSVGNLILSALHELTHPPNPPKTPPSLPIILIGHDRGARIAHHLHLAHLRTPSPTFHITGLALLDIVPTLSQWSTGASAASATSWFHWSFLANASLAVPMISAFGGANWARCMIDRWAGSNAAGRASMAADDAGAVYAAFFDRDDVVLATTRDYEAGATVDLEFESAAVERGDMICVPLLLVYSKEFLPKRARVPVREVWSRPWSAGGEALTECAIAGGVGHFVPEEAPEETAEAVREWLVGL